MAATACPGRARATRTASGCPRSCCSRRRWPPCSTTTRASCERFPDVQALAAAPLDDVLALWSGLGYYSRARNLHRCAQAVVARARRRVSRPAAAALATLPGIGRSTAAAIAAFCFGERAAILDGNVKRVLTRALGFGGDLARPAEQRALWQRGRSAAARSATSSAYTQGLMDLGATRVPGARARSCGRCPLAERLRGARARARPSATR
ncbi:MAG: hypothetical protein MZW92_62900 [Comamonadaceae bacterium]|nr:hypothetical protein [Comamonadaceae bacterium]